MQRFKFQYILLFIGFCSLFACQWNKPDYKGWRENFAALGDSTLLLKMSEASNSSVAEIISSCKIGSFPQIVVTKLVDRPDSLLFDINFWLPPSGKTKSGKAITFGMASDSTSAYTSQKFRDAHKSLLVATTAGKKVIPVVFKDNPTSIQYVLCDGKVVWSKHLEWSSIDGYTCSDCLPSVDSY